MEQRTLLAVFAHPDDESFAVGGTLARCSAEGIRVILACATRGEVGEISDPSLAAPENLGQVREAELRCAAQALGIAQLHLLGYRDSGMPGAQENQHPLALCRAHPQEVTGRIVHLIWLHRPQVVLTFDPSGGYGHPDHVAVHRHASAAFQAAPDPESFPEGMAQGLKPHRPERLYYSAIPRERFQEMARRAKALGMEDVLGGMPRREMGVAGEDITTEVALGPYVEAKERAIACHRTQLNPRGPWARIPRELRQEFMSRESFIRAIPPFPRGQPREGHLFPFPHGKGAAPA